MNRIGNVGLLDPQQLSSIMRLQQIGKEIAKNTLQLSTRLRINSAADDPAGLVSMLHLQEQLSSLEATSSGLSQANALVGYADAAAGNILDELQAARAAVLEVAGGGLSDAEVAGQQAAVDNILRSIDTQAGTKFKGRGLLDGSAGYRVSGVDATKIKDLTILSKQTTADVAVSINVTTQATRATNSYTGGALAADATIQIAGPQGSTAISLSSGATTDDIAEAFNSVSYLTGVTATRIDGSQVNFNTVDYGSDAQMTIQATAGAFATTTTGTVSGTDAVATINGQSVIGDGSSFSVSTGGATFSLAIDPAASGVIAPFTISGEGLNFIIGSSPTATAQLGLPTLNTGSLNGVAGSLSSIASGGANSLTGGNAANALRIIDAAISKVTVSRGVIGSFQKYTLASASTLTSKSIISTNEALQGVAGADVPSVTAALATNRLLQQATLEALDIFNHNREDVLSLLTEARTRTYA